MKKLIIAVTLMSILVMSAPAFAGERFEGVAAEAARLTNKHFEAEINELTDCSAVMKIYGMEIAQASDEYIENNANYKHIYASIILQLERERMERERKLRWTIGGSILMLAGGTMWMKTQDPVGCLFGLGFLGLVNIIY